jgi:hypothetical protein
LRNISDLTLANKNLATYNFDCAHGNAVVVELILKEGQVLIIQNSLLDLEFFHVNSLFSGLDGDWSSDSAIVRSRESPIKGMFHAFVNQFAVFSVTKRQVNLTQANTSIKMRECCKQFKDTCEKQ